jgi:branched-chain amino acid transport system substrate-binding protein
MKEGSMKVAGLRALFAAFAATVSVTVGAQAQPAPLNIDAILPLTGGSAYSGLADSQTVAAFEKYANAHGGVRGQPIHFIVSDDQSNPSVAVQLTNAAIARHVPVIAGSGVTATCAAMGAAAAATGPVTFCMSPGYAPPPNSYAFASTATIVSSAHAQLTYAKMRNFRRIAFLVSTDATGIVSAQVYAALLKQPDLRDVELVADERISNSEISAAAQMAKIKAARPDVLYTSTSGTLFATVMRGMTDVGLNIPVITTTANANLPQLKALADVLPHELFFNGFALRLGDQLRDKSIRDQIAAFEDAFKATGVTPTDTNALGWDELLLTLAGFRQFGPTMTAEQLKTFVLGQKHFAGMNGYYNFSSGDQHGLGPDAVVVISYDKEKGDFYPASQPGGVPLKR